MSQIEPKYFSNNPVSSGDKLENHPANRFKLADKENLIFQHKGFNNRQLVVDN